MKKRFVSILLTAAMCGSLLAGCGGNAGGSSESTDNTGGAESTESEDSEDSSSGDGEVLEFYHGYYQDESEWAAAEFRFLLSSRILSMT